MPNRKARLSPERIQLRDVCADDLPVLFQHQLDPDANRMAVAYPRDAEAFREHWTKVLGDRDVVAKAILVDDQVVGLIACFPREGKNSIGYWVAKEHWGKGIATRALALLLEQLPIRPLHALAARNNIASLRVLERCGFAVVGYRTSPETDRFPACEETVLILERATG